MCIRDSSSTESDTDNDSGTDANTDSDSDTDTDTNTDNSDDTSNVTDSGSGSGGGSMGLTTLLVGLPLLRLRRRRTTPESFYWLKVLSIGFNLHVWCPEEYLPGIDCECD